MEYFTNLHRRDKIKSSKIRKKNRSIKKNNVLKIALIKNTRGHTRGGKIKIQGNCKSTITFLRRIEKHQMDHLKKDLTLIRAEISKVVSH